VAKKTHKREKLSAPTSDYTDAQGNVLTLRGSLTAGARREYADTLAGTSAPAASTQEDAWQRAVELLFERLAVSWTIAPHAGAYPEGHRHPEGHRQAGPQIKRQKELLARLRTASPQERAWVREALREHCAEWFPDVKAP
jgi:hypothetical protein